VCIRTLTPDPMESQPVTSRGDDHRPGLEVVSLATRHSVRVVAEAGSLWWWPQVVEIAPVSDVPGAATRVAAVLGGHAAADLSQSADRRAGCPLGQAARS
jgi:hypothetical protein